MARRTSAIRIADNDGIPDSVEGAIPLVVQTLIQTVHQTSGIQIVTMMEFQTQSKALPPGGPDTDSDGTPDFRDYGQLIMTVFRIQ